jgi:hypothetical protein
LFSLHFLFRVLFLLRLIRFGGIREPKEYLEFLKQRHLQQTDHVKQQKDLQQEERYQNHELREEIEFEMHSSEHNSSEEDEDEEIVKFLTETLYRSYKVVTENISAFRMEVRLFIGRLFSTSKADETPKVSLLQKTMTIRQSISKLPSSFHETSHRLSSRLSSLSRSSPTSSGSRSSSLSRPSSKQQNLHGSFSPVPSSSPTGALQVTMSDGSRAEAAVKRTGGRQSIMQRTSQFFSHSSPVGQLKKSGTIVGSFRSALHRLSVHHGGVNKTLSGSNDEEDEEAVDEENQMNEVPHIPLKERLTFKYAKSAAGQQQNNNRLSIQMQQRSVPSSITPVISPTIPSFPDPQVGLRSRASVISHRTSILMASSSSAAAAFANSKGKPIPSHLLQANPRLLSMRHAPSANQNNQLNNGRMTNDLRETKVSEVRLPSQMTIEETEDDAKTDDFYHPSNQVEPKSTVMSGFLPWNWFSHRNKVLPGSSITSSRDKRSRTSMFFGSLITGKEDNLNKFKAQTDTVEQEFHSIFIFRSPKIYLRYILFLLIFWLL